MTLEIGRRLIGGIWRTGSSDEGGGGGSQPITREQVNGDTVTITTNHSVNLEWTDSDGPDSLLAGLGSGGPTIITAGVYAVTLNVQCRSEMTPGAYYNIDFEMDYNGGLPFEVSTDSTEATVLNTSPYTAIGGVYYLPAGAGLRVAIFNVDSISNDFRIHPAIIQRLS